MATKKKMTVSVRATTPGPTSAERRAAQVAMVANKQAQLKDEAAQRRHTRELREAKPAK